MMCICIYKNICMYVYIYIYIQYTYQNPSKGPWKMNKNKPVRISSFKTYETLFPLPRNSVSAPKSPRHPGHTRLIHAADFIGATPPVNWELVGLLVCQGRKVFQQWKNIVYNCFSWKKQSFNVIPDPNIYISQKFSNRSSPPLNLLFPFVDIDFGIKRSFSAFRGAFSV